MDDVAFFNITAPEPRPETPGHLLPRLPASVRSALSPRGRFIGMSSTGVEVRFVTASPNVRVTLSTPTPQTSVTVYRGDFEHSIHVLPQGRLTRLDLSPNGTDFGVLRPDARSDSAFAPDVWRIVIQNGEVIYHGLDALGETVRPPRPEELPPVRWLAYGSSITNANAKGYPHQAAHLLGLDVLNKGMSGSCRVEPELVDHLAELDWDFATCELGVNMRGDIEPDEFRRRVEYLLDTWRARRPGRPIGLITVFPNAQHHLPENTDNVAATRQRAFDKILGELASTRGDDGVFLIRGDQLLDRFTGLHTDLLHPCDFGHVRMGANLASLLEREPSLSALLTRREHRP